MKSFERLPALLYFTLRGKSGDDLRPVVDYIYRQWFRIRPTRLNEHSRAKVCKYREETDRKGERVRFSFGFGAIRCGHFFELNVPVLFLIQIVLHMFQSIFSRRLT